MSLSFIVWLLSDDISVHTSSQIESGSLGGDFETWFLANGGYLHPSVEIASAPDGKFLRVQSGQTLPASSTVVSCPHRLTMSWPSAHNFHFHDVRPAPFEQHIATRLFIMKQYLLEERSSWWPYVKSLPQSEGEDTLSTPLWYASSDSSWLCGTNLEGATREREIIWRREYDDILRVMFPARNNDQQRKLWSWSVFFHYRTGSS